MTNDQSKTPTPKKRGSLSANEEQIAAANRAARELGGALVDPAGGGGEGAGDGEREGGAGHGGPASRPPVWVRLPGEGWPVSKFAKEVGAVLCTNGVFRRENIPVTVNAEEGGRLEVMSPTAFRTYIEQYMLPAKFSWGKEDPEPKKVPTTVNKDVAAAVLESPFFLKQQRKIRRVNRERMPVVRADGTVELLLPGYDAAAEIFTMHTALDIDEAMPMEQAKVVLEDLLREFPFGDFKGDTEENRAAGVVGLSRSKAVHIGNMVGLFGAGMLNELANRLHFVYVANAQRSGKTLLAKTAVVPIFGPSRVTPLPKDENELRKKLDSAAISNAAYFFLDDLEGMLRSTELNAFMTAPTWSNRRMNTQTDFAALKQTVVIITGNNLSLSTDIANRTLRCSLYTEEFDAQARKIERVIDEEYLARDDVRARVLSALWCLIREWDKAGRPRGGRVLKGFEAWCEMFGGIVKLAGFGDPIEPPPADDYSGDTEGSDMLTLIERLVGEMDNPTSAAAPGAKRREFTFDELVECSQANDCFSWMIKGATKRKQDEEWFELDQSSKSALGKMFAAKYGGRTFRLADGRSIRFGSRGRNRHRKYLVEIL
jgi:hypothetical protein